MQRISFILFGYLVVGTVAHQSVAAFNDPILKEIKPRTITIIGETHQQKEFIWFFQSLIMDSLKKNHCLKVGLEISNNQQMVIDQVMQGRATSSIIEIPSMIDHLPFRKMIDSLAGLSQNGACLKLVTIDAGNDIKMARDQWMALKLADQVASAPPTKFLFQLSEQKPPLVSPILATFLGVNLIRILSRLFPFL
jgi:hypothetical protein